LNKLLAGEIVAFDTRELLARLLKCEADAEGDDGMRAVASVIINRANAPDGEFARVSNGGDVRAIIEQPGQFTCLKTSIGGVYNSQNIYNMNPTDIHYEIADWALAGNTDASVGNSLFYFNPYSSTCPTYFPSNVGVIYNRVGDHCFYSPTAAYSKT
jgi:N-acetylmuramoyl-L-alanine amidase